MRPLFHSSLQDNLGKLAKNEYASDEERDALLQAVFETQNIKPRDVVWMAYRPERHLRDGAVRLLRRLRTTDTINQFVVESKGKSETALRAATEILFGLRIPGIEKHLTALLAAEDENVRDATRRLVFEAPVTPALSSLFWNLAESPNTGNRSVFLERLATMDLAEDDLARWVKTGPRRRPDGSRHRPQVPQRQAPRRVGRSHRRKSGAGRLRDPADT